MRVTYLNIRHMDDESQRQSGLLCIQKEPYLREVAHDYNRSGHMFNRPPIKQ